MVHRCWRAGLGITGHRSLTNFRIWHRPACFHLRLISNALLSSAKGAVPRRQETEGTRISAAARTRPVLRVFLKSGVPAWAGSKGKELGKSNGLC